MLSIEPRELVEPCRDTSEQLPHSLCLPPDHSALPSSKRHPASLLQRKANADSVRLDTGNSKRKVGGHALLGRTSDDWWLPKDRTEDSTLLCGEPLTGRAVLVA